MSTSKMRPTRDRLMVGTRRRLPRRHNNAVSPRGGLEGLEDRVLLASGINTVQGISGAYLQVDAKVFNALGSDLAFLESDYNAYQTAHPGPGVPDNYQVSANQPDASILGVRNRSLVIDSVAKPGQTAVLQAQIAALGARVTGTYGAMVSAYVPLGQLAGLAGLSTLNYARASYTPVTSAGKVDDQAVGALRSDIGSAQFGTTGAGVIVGLLSDSFNNKNGYNTDVTSGDLPAGVNVLQDLGGGGTDEGRAMAQLVYDVAPGVGLAFNTAFNGQAGFATGITNLAKPAASGGAGAKVVSDDVFYYAEPMFQDGVVAQAVNNAVNAYGISYFSSAGNQSRSAYQSAFNTNTLASLPSWAPASATTTFHNFNPSGTADIYQPISIPAGTQIIIDFQWDQSYASAGGPGSTNDINLFLVNAAKTAVVASAISNNLNGDPSEVFAYNNTSSSAVTVNLAVNLKSGAAPGLMKYVLFNGTISNYATNTGASFGHNQAINAAGVGATRYDATPAYGVNPPQLEYFSSAGGSPILFDAAGNRLASPESRPQPRFTSIDGSDTTFFGGDYEGNALPNFFGTSAAAPHAAAVAALMKSAVPSLTATQIYAALQSTAIDQGAAGYDYDTGYGLIQADKALAAVTGIGISGTVFQDTNGNGIQDGSETGIAGATVFLDSNANNAIDTVTNTSIASTDVPKAIPDGTQGSPSRVTSALTVSGLTGRLTKVTVSLDIIHSYDSDLIVTLISPSGIRVPLFSSIGGPSRGGTNFTNTVLDDAAATAIQASLAPFSGTFRPQVALAALIGDDPNGTWRLEARDAWSSTRERSNRGRSRFPRPIRPRRPTARVTTPSTVWRPVPITARTTSDKFSPAATSKPRRRRHTGSVWGSGPRPLEPTSARPLRRTQRRRRIPAR